MQEKVVKEMMNLASQSIFVHTGTSKEVSREAQSV
jgi:hypothetical protein